MPVQVLSHEAVHRHVQPMRPCCVCCLLLMQPTIVSIRTAAASMRTAGAGVSWSVCSTAGHLLGVASLAGECPLCTIGARAARLCANTMVSHL